MTLTVAVRVVTDESAGTASVEVQSAKTVRIVRASAPKELVVRVIDRSPIISISIFNMASQPYCQSIISKNDISLVVFRKVPSRAAPI